MKKSTGILIFVIFIFIAILINQRRTEHFGMMCDIVDNVIGRCRLKPELMNDKIYGTENVEKWNEQCVNLTYNIDGCVREGSPKIDDQEVETYDPETQIVEVTNLSKIISPEVKGDGNLCWMDNPGGRLSKHLGRMEDKYGDYMA
jgi:hypothetical protein